MTLDRFNRFFAAILGLLFLIIFFITLLGIINSRSDASSFSDIEYWLNRYQTLFAAGIALFAAYLAWRAASLTIKRTDTSIEILRHQHATGSIQHIVNRMKTLITLRSKANDCWFAILQSDYSEIFHNSCNFPEVGNMSPVEKAKIAEEIMQFANNAARITSQRHAVLAKNYTDFYIYFENSPLTLECKKACSDLYWLTNSMGGLSSSIVVALRNYGSDCLADKDVTNHAQELLNLQKLYNETRNSDSYNSFYGIIASEIISLELLLDRTLKVAETEV